LNIEGRNQTTSRKELSIKNDKVENMKGAYVVQVDNRYRIEKGWNLKNSLQAWELKEGEQIVFRNQSTLRNDQFWLIY